LTLRGALAQVLERSQVQSDAVRREIERLVSPLPAHPATTLLPFTPRVRKALQFAGAEAAALEHPLISPEHVLLGLLIEGGGVAAVALKNLGVQLKPIRAEVFATWAHDQDSI
jgi:ATP-dependent Clp protease ATP-binding subunit ClpC